MRTPVLILSAALLLTGCSIKQLAFNAVADGLSSGSGGAFTQDQDLQFMGEALPFALKMMESINSSVPEHVALKLTLASGFTQYGVVFVEWPAEQLKYENYSAYNDGKARARGFYLRANDYAMTGLDLMHPGVRSRMLTETDVVLAEMTAEDVPLLFWLGASWLAAALTDLEDPEMFGLLPVAAGIVMRCFELDPDWNDGTIRSMLISLEPSMPGPGGQTRSQEHYDIVTAKYPDQAGPHVALANAVALKNQDKAAFVALLDKALAVDLDASLDDRLANDYAQQKAEFLLAHLDDLFLE